MSGAVRKPHLPGLGFKPELPDLFFYLHVQRFNKEDATLKSLIDKNIKSNVKLIETLTDLSKMVKALTQKIQRLNDKKPNFQLLLVYLRNETYGIYLAHTALSDARNTHYEFQNAKIKSKP